jgi:hypothetical protein
MHRDLNRSGLRNRRACFIASLLAVGALFGIAARAQGSTYQLTDLVTDDVTNNDTNGLLAGSGLPPAAQVDPNLINPWGGLLHSHEPVLRL